jgi:hypothetical protein
MSNKAASNVIPMRDFDRTSPADPQGAQFERLLKECQKLAMDRLSQAVAGMLDKAEESLWALADSSLDRELRNVYISAKDKAIGERKAFEDQFRQNYLSEFERRAKREAKRDQFSQYDLSSLELGLVNDEDLEETLKVNDMAAKLRRYCEEELNALDQRIGVLIGDANLAADGNPFSPQAVCNAWKQTCRILEPAMKIRMIFHKLFDDHVLDEVRSIYKDINALLIQRSILPKIRFGVRRGANAIGRRPGASQPAADPAGGDASAMPGGVMPGGMNPLVTTGMQTAIAAGDTADGYSAEAGGGDQDLFSVLQSLLARSAHAGVMAGGPGGAAGGAPGAAGGGRGVGIPGVPGGLVGGPLIGGVGIGGGAGVARAGAPGGMVGGMPAGGVVQIPGFPPIMGGPDAAAGIPGAPMLPGTVPGIPGALPLAAGDGTPLPQRFLQGAELIGSLTRLQHGDVAALPVGMPGIDLSALISGKTNVVRELKSSGLGSQVDQTDGVTIDIVAMLFDQIFGDKRVPEALKALIGRLQIPVVKVAVLDKKFFSKKSHPARRMLDTLGEFSLGLDETFDQSSPLYKKIEDIIARLLEEFVDNVDIFETLQGELLEVIREENKRAEISAKEMARKIAYKERLEVGKAMAQLEIKNRAQSTQLPQLVQKFLANDWMKLLLLTYARHGQDSDAWKSALETMDHLIWSVTFKPSIEDRRKLAHLLPGLLRRLQVGLQSLGGPEEKRKQFFSKLMRMHTKAMSGAAPKPSAVPTLNEAVIPTSVDELAQNASARPAAPEVSPPLSLALPSVSTLDFGLEPLPAQAQSGEGAKPPVTEHVVATPSIPVMTPATPAATEAPAAAAEQDDDAESAPVPLEFSNVTIRNPFGDGDIEVEEISLSDLPGFGAPASSASSDLGADQHNQAVKKLKAGDWLEFREGEAQRLQAKLSYISPLKGTYLFVNRQGESVGEYSLAQLAQELRAARAVVLEDVPLIERAMSSLVGVLKKNTR